MAGCGGGGAARLSKPQYEQRIQRDGQGVRKVFTRLARPPSSLQILAAEIRTGQEKLRLAAADLAALKPPQPIARDNAVLVAGLRRLADQLEPLRLGAARGDVKLVQRALRTLEGSSSLKAALRATADMRRHGYEIGALGQ
ncbi:MAG TPA: hypothetical protein VF002_10770 [Gaiellaceae bacterium]